MRFFTSKALFTLAIALMLTSAQDVSAQENTILGYTNIYTKLIATPDGAGQVCANTSTTGMKIFKDEFDLKQTMPVNHMFVEINGKSAFADYLTYYLHAKPTEGFTFAGWYKDDGDGQLDTNKDELLSTEADYPYFVELDAKEITLYNTSSEASKGEFPETPTVIFGHFTQGAVVSLSYYQDADNANCGSVFIDKLANAPGDQVTVRAIPNDGFKFEYWEDSRMMGNVISTENPYTFTVQGGERLYAYFTAINAPVAELPEEGGFKVMYLNDPWVMTEESMKNGAHVIVLEKEDFTRDAEGRTYLNMDNEEVMAKGYLEKIGLDDSFLTHTVNDVKHKMEEKIVIQQLNQTIKQEQIIKREHKPHQTEMKEQAQQLQIMEEQQLQQELQEQEQLQEQAQRVQLELLELQQELKIVFKKLLLQEMKK